MHRGHSKRAPLVYERLRKISCWMVEAEFGIVNPHDVPNTTSRLLLGDSHSDPRGALACEQMTDGTSSANDYEKTFS